ncbi:MAG: BON domain-containing protein [Thermodesulfobacteriota bacterium]
MKAFTAAALGIAIAVSGSVPALADDAGSQRSQDQAAQSAPDNTGRNVRDRDDASVTPMDQGNSEQDLKTTQQIRREVVSDDNLSTKAHNVKIVTNNGVVTLRGPVESAEEKERIASVAKKVAGEGKVRDQLEVAR